jgi:hypothetical protein
VNERATEPPDSPAPLLDSDRPTEPAPELSQLAATAAHAARHVTTDSEAGRWDSEAPTNVVIDKPVYPRAPRPPTL